jgi:hypothetical protein
MYIWLWCKRQKERGHWYALHVVGRIILRWISEKWYGAVGTGLISLTIGKSGGFF